jgi:hypothetical protein
VAYNGYDYAALDGWSPFDSSNEGCQSSFLPLPVGWSIAPNSADSIAVIAGYGWGTDLMVLTDGSQYYTLNNRFAGHAGQWQCCAEGLTALGQQINGGVTVYAVNACARRILIRRVIAVTTPTSAGGSWLRL